MPGVRPGALLGHTPGLWTPPASGPAFSPLTLSPAAWFDFSTLAAADGSAIASIADLSGNARTASQATGANQPLVKAAANGINNLTVGLFDGINDVLLTAAFALAQPFTLYAVVAGGGAGPNRYFSDGAAGVLAGYGTGPDNPNNFAGSALTVVSGVAANPKVITSVFNGASSFIRIDGTQVVSGAVGTTAIASGVALGAAATVQFWTGKIGELLLQPGATVSTAYEAALKAKWGTP